MNHVLTILIPEDRGKDIGEDCQDNDDKKKENEKAWENTTDVLENMFTKVKLVYNSDLDPYPLMVF